MAVPKPLYSATISYRTPAGRRVLYGAIIAVNTLTECLEELRRRLANEAKYGRRKVATILEDFSASFICMQISTK